MGKDSDFITGSLLGGIFGWLLGSSRFKEWEDFIKNFEKRLNHLAYFKVIIPIGLYPKIRNFYREGVLSYLFGLPNSSVPMLIKSLEIGVKEKYKKEEKKDPPKNWNLYNLIEWCEQYLGRKKELAHGFRILRNIIHEEKSLKEQDALECIRHTSEILVELFPFSTCKWGIECTCRNDIEVLIEREKAYIGNVLTVTCNRCKSQISFTVMP